MTPVVSTSDSHSESKPRRSMCCTACTNASESDAPAAPRPTPMRIFMGLRQRLQCAGDVALAFCSLHAVGFVDTCCAGERRYVVPRRPASAQSRTSVSEPARCVDLRSIGLRAGSAGHGPGGLWRGRGYARPASTDAYLSGDL